MPSVPHSRVDKPDPNAIHVLITGFGPFWRYEENPSWAAVKPLHNSVIWAEMQPPPPPEPQSMHHLHPLGPPSKLPPLPPPPALEPSPSGSDAEMQEDAAPVIQQIYITTLQIPVLYADVLSVTPGLHAKPPQLPPPADPAFAPRHLPENGFDFIFHIGVAGRGPLRLEKLAHKLGYRMKDADYNHAPVVQLPKEIPPEQPDGEIMAKVLPPLPAAPDPAPAPAPVGLPIDDDEALPEAAHRHVDPLGAQQPRGFGKGYENLPDELYTEIDVPRLIHHLKETGIQKVYSSMDAGHFLCDFLFYASLAEAKRHAAKSEKEKTRSTPPKMTPVLFMHCPPVGKPFDTEEVTDAIKKVVLWVCARLSV